MINKLIIDTLKPLNIPVEFLIYTGNETTYVTFQTFLETGENYSEDEEETTGHYFLLNLFTKGDNTVLIKQIKDLLKVVGIKRETERDIYETDTFYFNHAFRFIYLENLI